MPVAVLGSDEAIEYTFLALIYSEPVSQQESLKIAQRLRAYFLKKNPFLLIETAGNEIHLRPSRRSDRMYFYDHAAEIEEWQMVLKYLELETDIVVDGDVRPFRERVPPLSLLH